MEAELLRDIKEVVERGNLDTLQTFYDYLQKTHEDEDVDWPYILQKTYLHACLKKRRDMVDWLGSLFEQMDPINRIAYRHTLNYGKVLINKWVVIARINTIGCSLIISYNEFGENWKGLRIIK